MDEKRRSKRAKPLEEGTWDCSVCTYKNPSEAFKCEMCDVRKGTSTRKPRLNQQLVAQQAAQQFPPPPAKKEKSEKGDREKTERKEGEEKEVLLDQGLAAIRDPSKDHIKEGKEKTCSHAKRKSSRPPRLRNIDRSSGTSMEVTVDDVTVIITDYKPKKRESHSNATITTNNNTSPGDRTQESPSAPSGSSKEQNSSLQSSPEMSKSPITNCSMSSVPDGNTTPKVAITEDVKET